MRQSKVIPKYFRGAPGSNRACWSMALAVLAVVPLVVSANSSPGMSLTEAESLALGHDPVIAAARARSAAMTESAVADGQLPDPKLTFGLWNLPLDTFDVEQNPTTQLRLGLQQSFPRGKTLQFRQRQTEWQATTGNARADDETRKVVRGVREKFLEVWYQSSAGEIIDANRELFAQLVEITESHYGSGRVSQQDVLRARLELARLDDRATRIRTMEEINRASLAKWIGTAASRSLEESFPALAILPDEATLVVGLKHHPAIQAQSARIEVANRGIDIAREQYKPGWSLGLQYRKRFGENPDSSDRADLAAVMATVDLPLFPAQRQDRRVAASLQQAEAAMLDRDDRMRELKELLERDYARWRRLGERQLLYETQLNRDAAANGVASLSAYQSGVTEFTTLMRARITELDVRLESLRVRVDRAQAHARLLYLANGDEQ